MQNLQRKVQQIFKIQKCKIYFYLVNKDYKMNYFSLFGP
jgi:hypothetical protein